MLSWIVRKAGAGTILAFSLLLGLVEILVWVLQTSIRGLENSWLPFAVALGLLAGWMSARSRLRGWQAALAGTILGISLVIFHSGRLAGPLGQLFLSLPLTRGRFIRWEGLLDLSLLPASLQALWAGTSIPVARLAQWSASVVAGQPAYDPAAIVMFWSLLAWAISLWQAWAFRRHSRPLLAVVPAGALLAATLNYTRQSTLPLAAFLAVTLLIFSLSEIRNLIWRWESHGIDYSEDIRFDMAYASLGLVLVLTTAAVLAPSLSIRQVVEWSRRMLVQEASVSGKVAESFGLRPGVWQKSAFADYSSPGLPRSHLLGSGPELSEQVVMVVQVEGLPAPDIRAVDTPAPRFYWRGLTYDRYSGRGWFTGSIEVTIYPADELIQPEDFPTQRQVHQEVRLFSQAGPDGTQLLYVTGELASADQQIQVARRSHQDLFGVLGSRNEYQAISFIPAVSEEQLRSSGQDYPQWVQERYLALPEGVPPRVLGLGRDLTGTAATPYDRALAIESYLRSIPYSLEVPAPPTDRDVSDYFLFDLKRGYCDYYATAMVVLARAAGLPSRLATGYASGQYDPESSTFIVTAADAHSWVEIYFPGYGWIEFEPTGGRPAIERAVANLPEMDEPGVLRPPATATARTGPLWKPLFTALSILVLMLVAGVFTWQLYDGWSLKRLTPSRTIAALYRRLYQQGRFLDEEITPAYTPHELAGQLGMQIIRLAQAGRFPQRLIPAQEEVRQLAELYARSAYSPHPAGEDEQECAVQAWRKLQWRLWLARLIAKKPAPGV